MLDGSTAPLVSNSLYVRYTVLVDTLRFLAMSLYCNKSLVDHSPSEVTSISLLPAWLC